MTTVYADPRYARITVRTECPRCGVHLPINGAIDEVGCDACGHHVPLPRNLIVDILRTFERTFPRRNNSDTVICGDMTWRWTSEVVDLAPCRQCGAALSVDGAGTACCPQCAEAHTVRRLPASIRSHVRTGQWVIGGEDSQTRPDTPPAPVALLCPQCSGSLMIGADRPRVTVCDFCGTQVHLPDAVWRQLHPPREVQPWVVRFEGEGAAAADARRQKEAAEKKRKRQAQKREQQAQKRRLQEAEQQRLQEEAAEKKALRDKHMQQATIAGWVAWALSLGAVFIMSLTTALYFFPSLYGMMNISGDMVHMVNHVLFVAGSLSFLTALLLGVGAIAYRADLPLSGTIRHALLHALLVCIPPVGPIVGVGIGLVYLSGRMPRPMGTEWKHHRHPVGSTLHLTLLFFAVGFFSTVMASTLLDMTIWEMVEALPED